MARASTRTSKRKTATKKKTAAKRTATKKKTAAKRTAAKKKTTAKKKTAAKKTATKKAATKAKAAKPKPIKKLTKAEKPKNTNTLSYTQTEFLENLKGFCGLEKRTQAKELWNDIAAFITDALKRGYKVPLVGLGKMYVRKTKARVGRNPATGEMIQIPARKRVRFTATKSLKDSVL